MTHVHARHRPNRRALLPRAAVFIALPAALAGCTGRALGVQQPASPDVAGNMALTTAPSRPVRAVFGWSMVDPDARFSGQGVARISPDYRARLDLFGPRGESYLTAALFGEEIELPPGSNPDVPLPPATLLWSTIGVFRPPAGAALVATRQEGDRIRLEYAAEQIRWRFTIERGRLTRVEMDTRQGRHSVELRGDSPLRLPRQAVYRDHAAFRELVLTLDEAEQTEEFLPGVWTFDAH